MFSHRNLSDPLVTVRKQYAPEATVLDVTGDFETIPPAAAEDLGLFADKLEPVSYPDSWLTNTAPKPLHRYASSDLTIGMPGDGTVVRTEQTVPPTILVKGRASGTPTGFLNFLIAEALVESSIGLPEHFLGYFEDEYTRLAAAVPLDPASPYQIASALFDGWIGLHTRSVFTEWEDSHPRLYDSWIDAGTRIEGRLGRLSEAVAHGETSFAEATEYACAAIKHGLEIPPPFAALDTQAYQEYGAEYGIKWASKTFDKMDTKEQTE